MHSPPWVEKRPRFGPAGGLGRAVEADRSDQADGLENHLATHRTAPAAGRQREHALHHIHARHHLPEGGIARSEEHTSELQSLMRISYAVFCLKKKKTNTHKAETNHHAK